MQKQLINNAKVVYYAHKTAFWNRLRDRGSFVIDILPLNVEKLTQKRADENTEKGVRALINAQPSLSKEEASSAFQKYSNEISRYYEVKEERILVKRANWGGHNAVVDLIRGGTEVAWGFTKFGVAPLVASSTFTFLLNKVVPLSVDAQMSLILLPPMMTLIVGVVGGIVFAAAKVTGYEGRQMPAKLAKPSLGGL